MTKSLPIYLLAVTILVLAVGLFFNQSTPVDGAGWLPTHIQSATTTTVGPDTVVTLFADQTSATCKGRLVTTNNDAINISFDDVTGFGSTTLAEGVGHYQAASTSVMYDSALYGCGLTTALGLTASGTVTISSF